MSQQNFNERLITLLKTNPDFTDESGELLPAAVKDSTRKLDHNLLRLRKLYLDNSPLLCYTLIHTKKYVLISYLY